MFIYYLILFNNMVKQYKIIRKLRKTGTSIGVNIPKEIIEIMKIKEGDLVEIEIKKISK